MLSAITVLPAVRLFTIIAAFVAVVETLWPAQSGVRVLGRAVNVAVFAFNIAAFGLIVELWPELFSHIGRWGLMDVVVPSRYHHTVLGIVGTTLVYAVVWDFFQYWSHRAQHEWRVLWPMHAVHHSDRCMNATTSGRRSIPSTFVDYVVIHIPTVFIVGPTLLTVVGATVLFSGWGYLNHANVRLPFRRATGLLSGPQLHRMHHGAGERYHDSNYAALFPVLDRIFGTQLLPEPSEWPNTGVTDDVQPLAVGLFWPWRLPRRARSIDKAARPAAWSGAVAPGRHVEPRRLT